MSDEQRKLIDAVNLIAEHATNRLPEGWEIALHFSRGEAWCELTDPDGNDVDVQSADIGYSTIAEMCDTAIEVEEWSAEK